MRWVVINLLSIKVKHYFLFIVLFCSKCWIFVSLHCICYFLPTYTVYFMQYWFLHSGLSWSMIFSYSSILTIMYFLPMLSFFVDISTLRRKTKEKRNAGSSALWLFYFSTWHYFPEKWILDYQIKFLLVSTLIHLSIAHKVMWSVLILLWTHNDNYVS